MKSSGGNDFCEPHEISENKAMSTEDAKEDAANISSDNEGYSSSLSGDDARQPLSEETVYHAFSVCSSRKGVIDNSDKRLVDNDQSTNIDRGMDDRLEDRKDTNEIKNIKSNKRIVSSTSKSDQQESDDPRRGGKVCFDAEEPGSTDVSWRSNNHEQDTSMRIG